jgi:hypothetical protein
LDSLALADRSDLGLTEDKVRGAIRVLEEIGFLDRAIASGSRYKAMEDGLHRKPILFMFGADYAPAFIAANRPAAAARGRHSGERRALLSKQLDDPLRPFLWLCRLNPPKAKAKRNLLCLWGR